MTRGGAGFLVTPRPKNGPVITGRRLSRNVWVQVGRESTGDGRESDDDAFGGVALCDGSCFLAAFMSTHLWYLSCGCFLLLESNAIPAVIFGRMQTARLSRTEAEA